ncbi:MAG TPA: CPBP family intramembrane glutamic endopeptidase [Thermoanaerobaculia bacterium]|nr:CPBP family intramembrane glutamic endopeptidase [Thermoanaerobaculia bacterium]
MTYTSWRSRIALLAAAAAVYAIGLWPTWYVRDRVLSAAGHPAYAGIWKFLPHLLLYSTLAAVAAAIAWLAFARAGVLEPIALGRGEHPVRFAILGALGAIALALAAFVAAGQSAAIGWVPPDPWSIAGNLFSNFYEEFIFRGFLLTALAAVIRFWPAAIVTSVLWAATHTQFPLWLRIVICVVGVLFAWVRQRSKTVWSPWGAHMLMDIVLDSLIR